MLHLHRSNRAERLVDALAQVVRVPLADPLALERIVVQSRGIEQWLAMELSRRLGVWAHARFPFPRHLIESSFDAVLGEGPAGGSVFDEGALGWAIAKLLPTRLADSAFAPVGRYLEGDTDGARMLELAERIAGVFDDYVVYRPERVLEWENGKGDGGWQSVLFRDLVDAHGRAHQAARARDFVERMQRGAFDAAALPARVSVFGIATLPPLYLEVLQALARVVEVHLFVLAPTREYFGDTRLARGDERIAPAASPPLLASLGRLGREFQELLEERTEYVEREGDLFVDPGTSTALATLQSDMLHLRVAESEASQPTLAIGDDSIVVHDCHGPMREVEVLHDQLLALLEDTSLDPSDIVVLTPDVEGYEPFVEAVFGVGAGGQRIPYRIVRARARTTEEVALAFDAVLDTLAGRLGASQVLDLLDFDAVRERFGIAAAELDTLRAWVVESGIRWGVDAEHRAEVGQPELAENTWRFGLDRMLLGYASAGDGATLFGGSLPCAVAEGSAGELLGKLAELCATVFEWRTRLRDRRSVRAWQGDLSALLEAMVRANARTTPELQKLRGALAELAERAERAGFTASIDLPSLRRRLASALERGASARGFLAGGVTFCRLVPMRAVPFRVVCLLGMNDEVFPRRTPALGFDLLAREHQPGDRSVREDDRYAFLEAILSAREKLIVTYTGRGIQDNRTIPPSVVVAELIDALRARFAASGERSSSSALPDPFEARIVVRHRLHAFSPVYFRPDGDPRLFSYAEHYFGGAKRMRGERLDRPFFAGPLHDPEPSFDLDLEELEAWLTKPIETLLRRRLELALRPDLEPLDDREPFDLGNLEEWQLGEELLACALAGLPTVERWLALRASGRLPLGTPGRIVFDELREQVEGLAAAARPYRDGERLDPVEIDLRVGGVHLTGVVRDLWPRAHLHVGYSKIGRPFELRHWIRHVALACEREKRSRLQLPDDCVAIARHAKEGHAVVVHFTRPRDPLEVLRRLVELVRIARVAPLPLFRNASRDYASRVYAPSRRQTADALQVARNAFEGKGFKTKDAGGERKGDVADPYVALAFDGFDAAIDAKPLGFVAAAQALYEPFFASRNDG